MKPNMYRWFSYVSLCGVLVMLLLPPVRRIAEIHKASYACYLGALSFCLAFLLVPVMIQLGRATGLVDVPDSERKLHREATPLSGGLAIYVAFAASILLNFHFSVEMKAILVGSTIVLMVGLADDRWKVSAKIRLLAQVAVSLLLVIFGVRVTFVPPSLGGIYSETLITIIWLVGITNSMNFIDGMDGLASGTGIIYSAFFGIVALITRQPYMMFLAVALAGSTLGFFPYNFRGKRPARVFLGDSGATFLGFLLASFAILGEWGDSIVDLAIPVLIMSLLIFDMTLTTIVRVHSGEVRTFGQWLHYAGRDHVHHRLSQLGLGKVAATMAFFIVSLSFGLEALVLLYSDVWASLLVLGHSFLAFCLIGLILVVRTNGKVEVVGGHERE